MHNKSLYEQQPFMDMREFYKIHQHEGVRPIDIEMSDVPRDPELLYEFPTNNQAKHRGIPKRLITKIRQEEAATLQQRQQREAAALQQRQQREAAELQQRQQEEAQKRHENRLHKSFKKQINNLYKQGKRQINSQGNRQRKNTQSKKKSRFVVTSSATN